MGSAPGLPEITVSAERRREFERLERHLVASLVPGEQIAVKKPLGLVVVGRVGYVNLCSAEIPPLFRVYAHVIGWRAVAVTAVELIVRVEMGHMHIHQVVGLRKERVQPAETAGPGELDTAHMRQIVIVVVPGKVQVIIHFLCPCVMQPVSPVQEPVAVAGNFVYRALINHISHVYVAFIQLVVNVGCDLSVFSRVISRIAVENVSECARFLTVVTGFSCCKQGFLAGVDQRAHLLRIAHAEESKAHVVRAGHS